MKKIILMLIAIITTSIVMGAVYQQEFEPSDKSARSEAQFVVTALKYEPYPVNPGDYFDLWIKAENIGNTEAINAKFELAPKYPFSSTDKLAREYGSITGNKGKADENNQVVLKYRVKTANDAPEGISNIDFKTNTGNVGDDVITKSLPIEIRKTKTDFDVVMQDSTTQGTSIAISNTGEDPATAVTVTIKEQEGFSVKGPRSSIIGNLDRGDFTTLTFQINPKKKDENELLVQIDYTDTAGVRTSIEKKVEVDITLPASLGANAQINGRANNTTLTGNLLSKSMYIIAGFALGIIVMSLRNRAKKKRMNT